MKKEKYEMYFMHINSFISGKGLLLDQMDQSDILGFVQFVQVQMSKEICDSITYQIIDEITS